VSTFTLISSFIQLHFFHINQNIVYLTILYHSIHVIISDKQGFYEVIEDECSDDEAHDRKFDEVLERITKIFMRSKAEDKEGWGPNLVANGYTVNSDEEAYSETESHQANDDSDDDMDEADEFERAVKDRYNTISLCYSKMQHS
jgi:hypothetical protein